jgi:hypothetical protein
MCKDPTTRSVFENTKGSQITFCSHDYNGEGASQGLARGILVFSNGENLTGEGMGIGSIAFRKGGYTYFPSRCITNASGSDVTEKIFIVDTWRKWARKGRQSRYLTRFIEFTADCYMAIPWVQSILCVQSPLIEALSLHPVLEQIPPLARSEFLYACNPEMIQVSCKITSFHEELPRIFILNELDGDVFSQSLNQDICGPPPSGWRVCPGHAAFFSKELGICFRLTDIAVSGGSWRLFWGRERNRTLKWAGFEIMIDPLSESKSIGCSYAVRFGEGIGCEAY